MTHKPRLCFVTAVPMTVTAFLNTHIERLAADFDITVVSDFSGGAAGVSPLASHIHAPVARAISPLRDLAALWALFWIFRRQGFAVVHSVTPKAGLLSMMAGFLARVPVRIHWFTGQVWVTRQGMARVILKTADRVLARLATHLLADSPSQRDFLVAERVVGAGRITVIAQGSICGVDTQRFCPNATARHTVRTQHGIPQTAPVVLFLGRLNADKGLREMAQAMVSLQPQHPSLHWLVAGPDEENMQAHIQQVAAALGGCVHFQGYTNAPEAYMAAADIFCLPSYREGFGSSVLEAAAVGVPAVASRIYGLTDAVADGVSGVLVPVQNAAALAAALHELLADSPRRLAMGEAARERALTQFSRATVANGLAAYYAGVLGAGNTAGAAP